jgi:hypothetical protein
LPPLPLLVKGNGGGCPSCPPSQFRRPCHYHTNTMNEVGCTYNCIFEIIPTEQVTFFLLVTIFHLNFCFCLNFWSRCLILFPPLYMGTQGPLPTADSIFIEFVSCECKKACQTERCSCFKANLKCTELCQCSNSENYEIDEELIDNVNDFDEAIGSPLND